MKCNEDRVIVGLKQLEEMDYQNAIENLLPCAETGNRDAMAAVGLIYQLGLGVERDLNKAIRFLQVAAEKGDGSAAHNLGTLYMTCEPDMPIDPEKSKYWYELAKTLGFVVGE